MKTTLLSFLTCFFFLLSPLLAQHRQASNVNRLPTSIELQTKEELRLKYLEVQEINSQLKEKNLENLNFRLNVFDPSVNRPKEADFLNSWNEISAKRQYSFEPLENNPNVKNNTQKNGGSGNHIYVTGPEQNCGGALEVCTQTFTQASSYTGYGYQEVSSSTCLGSLETNSVWYIFTAQTSGQFGFTLNTANDYDFALYNITAGGCASVPTATPIRCNFSATYGNTGMSSAGTLNSASASDGPFCPELAVTAGQTYVLIVDNYSANSNGYTLTFTSGAGYASITDVTPPTINPPATVVNNCNGTFTLTFSESVDCSSIAANGSDFTISGGGTIVSALGVGCTASNQLTNQVTITYTVPTSGTFTVGVATGTDGNTILDKCGNAMLTSQSITLNTLYSVSLSASASAVCSGTAVTLTAGGAPNSTANIYTLAPGGTVAASNGSGQATFNVTPLSTTTYTVTSTFAGCTKTASQTITIVPAPLVSVSPMNPILCSGTTALNASATLNGVSCPTCTFQWSGSSSATTAGITVGAGTYSVTTTSPTGCVGSNTATTTVTVGAAAPSTTCNVYFVTATGAGTKDGTTIANAADPTTLVTTVLPATYCTGGLIKMETGTYNITGAMSVGSNVIIEGGYTNNFTRKTSVAGGTTITRSATNIEGTANTDPRMTAISCVSASGFRLQDLTITTANGPVASTLGGNSLGITTYGVYLNGCSSYDIVRCQITAGTGGTGANGSNGPAGSYMGDTPGSGGAGGAGSTNGCGRSGTGNSTAGNAATGGGGTGGAAVGGCTDDGCIFGCGANGCTASNGNTGGTGPSGSTGTVAATAGLSAGYYQSGGQSGTGGSGHAGGGGSGGGGGDRGTCCTCTCGSGSPDGGTGGTGGRGGLNGGTGGWAGGGSFSIFAYNNGASGKVTDCNLSATAGTGGSGGSGGAGVAGSAGSAGLSHGGCDLGTGGSGGAGGTGGAAGSGGAGATGATATIALVSGTNISYTNSGATSSLGSGLNIPANFSLSGQPTIVAGDATNGNVNCTGLNMNMTSAASSPDWTGSDAGLTGASSPKTANYSTTGRKNVVLGASSGNAATTFSCTATSAAISAASACPAAISNTITVSGYSSTVTSSAISVNMTLGSHSYFSDLSIFLIAPNGSVLGLTNNRGNGAACTLTNITFSDAGGSVMAAACPASGSTFKPETSTYTDCGNTSTITSFGAIGGGAYNPNGTWTLRIVDNANGDGGAAIAVGGWSISFPSNISASSNTYTDFNNMMMAAPSSGTISGVDNKCPGAYSFSSSVAGTSGYSYQWSVNTVSGMTPTIATATASTTDITFPNTTGGSLDFTVSLVVTSECCGALTTVTFPNITIYPLPAAPSAASASVSVCTGGSAALSVTAPANANYNWYTVSTGGTSFGAGSSYTVTPVVTGTTTYYIDAVDANGCVSSSRTPINAVGVITATPTISNVSTCAPGDIDLSVTSPIAGATYNWYTGSCGGTLVQSSPSTMLTVNVPAIQTNTYYVSATVSGCSASLCQTVTAQVTAAPATLTWTGGGTTGANNWFNAANWGGCLPTCNTNVSIPNTAGLPLTNPPDIGFSATGNAACKSITISSSNTLSFSDAKAELDVCGDFTQSGTLTTNNKGKIVFIGTVAQNYSRTGSGSLNDVVLNNTAGTATLTLNNDMQVGSSATTGSFSFQSGKVVTGVNKLIIRSTSNSAISGYNNTMFVYGNMRQYIASNTSTYTFPVGDGTATTNYKRADIVNNNLTGVTYVDGFVNSITEVSPNDDATFAAANQTQNGSPLQTINQAAQWDFTPDAAPSGGSYGVRLFVANTGLSSTDDDNFCPVKRPSASTTYADWVSLNSTTTIPANTTAGRIYSGGAGYAQRLGYTSFSKHAIAKSWGPLPVELINFDGKLNKERTVDLFWTTASEINCDYFIVQKSFDGNDFSYLGTVDSKALNGNSNSSLNYTLNDPSPQVGKNYYRLIQTDFDGLTSYSNVVVIDINSENELSFSIYPNPSINSEDLTIVISGLDESKVHIQIVDAISKLVFDKKVDVDRKDPFVFKLNKDLNLAPGTYFIRMKGRHFDHTERWVVKE